MPKVGHRPDNNELTSISRQYKANPWKFMQNFVSNERSNPNFDNITCKNYYTELISEKHPNRVFNKPDWMPPIKLPASPMVHGTVCPDYLDITKIVRSMRSKISPCPLDGISIIIFKRCPILRSNLTKLILACWRKKYFPLIWRRATVSLVYKKGDTSDPQNFRPIALQPVLGKVLNACIRNKLWSFLSTNDLVDTKMQKGFWPGVNGITEHVELMKYLLKIQKRHKRDIYVILLD